MSDSLRVWLDEQLTPLLPSGWTLIPNQRMPETITVTTVVLKHLEIERLDAAPLGQLRNTVVLTVADAHQNQTTAENELDESVLTLCTALDALKNLNWTGAKKVLVNDTYLGWDITLTVITSKE
ncbi:hypothetical protein [Parafrigoribacterium humi]|uniref:hypothetical protein n=1 Tax=Parafrigoribacterium humi TaxID=3144664 RepID=UPI0032EEB84A